MEEHLTPEQRIERERKARGIADGYPVYVWHPVYASVHPCACDTPEALALLRAEGWVTSREDLLHPTAVPMTPVPDDIDAMVAAENLLDRATRRTRKNE